MRDQYNNVTILPSITPIVVNNDTEGTGVVVDSRGYNSVTHIVHVGISGDTLSGSVLLLLKIQHGDLADGTDMAGVTDQYQLIGVSADLVAGLFSTIDDPAEDDVIVRIGYRGPKRYTRIFIDTTGTHTVGTPISAVAVLGNKSVSIG